MAHCHKIASIALILGLFPSVGLSQEWQQFGTRSGQFTFEVPPGFALTAQSQNGQEASFEGENNALLTVRGAALDQREFNGYVKNAMQTDVSDGWELTYRRVTPKWASYSGVRGGQIRYVRVILVCGDRVAVFVLDYRRDNKIAYDPVVVRMVRSLEAEGC